MFAHRRKTTSVTNWLLTSFLVVLIVFLIAGMCFLASEFFAMKQEINSIWLLLPSEKTHQNVIQKDYYYSYIELSAKAESEMDRLVSTVGILATVYTIFGALIVFKAPHEIDKRIDRIDSLTLEANDSAQEASYQAEIMDAVVNGYNGKMTSYDKLRRISKVIEKYPERPDAYMQRGFIYDDMGRYDEAISDYKIGLKNGIGKAAYYADMGVTYNKKGEYKKAILFYTRAIDLDQEDSSQYANRGSCYDDMGEYEKAISDYDRAINLDDGCKEAYINRSVTLKKQMQAESETEKKEELYNQMIADLQKALELDPDDMQVKKMMRNSINRIKFNPDEMIAKIDERIGDLELESNNIFAAFKQYIESCNYYLLEACQDNKNFLIDIERLVSKIFEIEKNDVIPELPKISEMVSHFCQFLRIVSVDFYVAGKKEAAEKSFLLLSRYDDSNDSEYFVNLAFMKRRGETAFTNSTVSELLSQCIQSENAFWGINKALCYVSGADNHEICWEKAVKVMKDISQNIDEAVDWWSKIEVVGKAENNMVMLLLLVSEKYQTQDGVSLDQRVNDAKKDGYAVVCGRWI